MFDAITRPTGRSVGRRAEALRAQRAHSLQEQIKQISASIERFGFTNPVLVSSAGEIIAGHGRVEAARLLGRKTVPLTQSHFSDIERRAYVLVDNKLALNAGSDKEILAIELQALVDLEFDVELTGFSLAEVDLGIDAASEASLDGPLESKDAVPVTLGEAVTRMADLWQLGRHRLLCGDGRDAAAMNRLMDGTRATSCSPTRLTTWRSTAMCGLGSVKHREFAFASGEMIERQCTGFLTETLGNIARVMRDRRDRIRLHGLAPHE